MAGLAFPGFKSKGSVHTKGRVFPTLQSKAPSVKVTGDNQSLCRSGKKQTPKRILASTTSETGGGKGVGPFISGFLQPAVSGAKTQQQVETHLRPQSAELIPSISLFQDGNPRDHPALPSKGGVGHLAGFQRCLLSCSDKSKVAEVLEIPSQQPNLSVHCPTSVGVHKGRQGGQTYGTVSGYSNPPVPRRLVSESPLPRNLPMAYPDPFGPMSHSRLGSQYVKVRAGSPAGVQLCRLSFGPLAGPGKTHAEEVDNCLRKSVFSWDNRPARSGSSCPLLGF